MPTGKAKATVVPEGKRAEISGILLQSLDIDEGRFQFDDFYIQEETDYSQRGAKAKKYALIEAACDNHIAYFKDPVLAYLAGEKQFHITQFTDAAKYAASTESIVKELAKVDYDEQSEEDWKRILSRCKRLLKAAPQKPKPVKTPRKKAGAK